jgi:hypothetical protein
MGAANCGSVGRGKAFQPEIVNCGMDRAPFSQVGTVTPTCLLSRESTRTFHHGFACPLPEHSLCQLYISGRRNWQPVLGIGSKIEWLAPIMASGESIIKTNGDVIFPKVMAKRKISEQEAIGSLLKKSGLEIVKQLLDADQFEFYYNEFLNKQRTIEVIKWALQIADR